MPRAWLTTFFINVGSACSERRSSGTQSQADAVALASVSPARPASSSWPYVKVWRTVAGARIGYQGCGELAHLRLGAGQGHLDREEPRHHALDVAVDRGGLAVEGNGGDRGSGIGADPGERTQALDIVGKDPTVQRH